MSEVNTKGEVTVDLDARYVMRPSYEAIEAIEVQTGHGIMALVNMAAEGEMTRRQCAIVVTECMKAWGSQRVAAGDASVEAKGAAGANADKVARLIHGSGIGLVGAVTRAALVLTAAATGGVTEAGEMKAETIAPIPAAD